jgi:hypothetical protein
MALIPMVHNSLVVAAKEGAWKIRLFQRSKWRIMDGDEWDEGRWWTWFVQVRRKRDANGVMQQPLDEK